MANKSTYTLWPDAGINVGKGSRVTHVNIAYGTRKIPAGAFDGNTFCRFI